MATGLEGILIRSAETGLAVTVTTTNRTYDTNSQRDVMRATNAEKLRA